MEECCCTKCNRAFEVPSEADGEIIKCPHCGAPNEVWLGGELVLDDVIDAIDIVGNQEAKRAETLGRPAMETKALKDGDAERQLTDEQKETLGLVESYARAGEWRDASSLMKELLAECSASIALQWKAFFLGQRCQSSEEFVKDIVRAKAWKMQQFRTLLGQSSKEMAAPMLDALYGTVKQLDDADVYDALCVALRYEYPARKKRIKEAFDWAIKKKLPKTFDLLLTTLEDGQVEEYIEYNRRYTELIATEKQEPYIKRILELDPGNIDIMETLLYFQLADDAPSQEVMQTLEKMLQYAPDRRTVLEGVVDWLSGRLNSRDDCELVKQILRYSEEYVAFWKETLMNLSRRAREIGCFAEAEYFAKVVVSCDAKYAPAYWELCMAKMQVGLGMNLADSSVALKTFPEYKKYLRLANESERQAAIRAAREQTVRNVARRKQLVEQKTRQLSSASPGTKTLLDCMHHGVGALIVFIIGLLAIVAILVGFIGHISWLWFVGIIVYFVASIVGFVVTKRGALAGYAFIGTLVGAPIFAAALAEMLYDSEWLWLAIVGPYVAFYLIGWFFTAVDVIRGFIKMLIENKPSINAFEAGKIKKEIQDLQAEIAWWENL